MDGDARAVTLRPSARRCSGTCAGTPRWHAHRAVQMLAQGGAGTEARVTGDEIDGPGLGFQQVPGAFGATKAHALGETGRTPGKIALSVAP